MIQTFLASLLLFSLIPYISYSLSLPLAASRCLSLLLDSLHFLHPLKTLLDLEYRGSCIIVGPTIHEE